MNDCIAHIHLSDASGSNAEGLEIGAGSIDFKNVDIALNLKEKTFMIPEVWQGHKDSGKGFWEALKYLENKGLR